MTLACELPLDVKEISLKICLIFAFLNETWSKERFFLVKEIILVLLLCPMRYIKGVTQSGFRNTTF